jgi:hypothetical protein
MESDVKKSAPLHRAILIADPGEGLRWLGWSNGWRSEAAASEAVERLETLSVSRQISDVAGFLRSGPDTWVVSRGGLMPGPESGSRYWREALQLTRQDLATIRANPFCIMPASPPALPAGALRVELPPIDELAPATVEHELARLRELRTRPWGRASWNIETLLAAALDVEHTLITGTAASLAALELLFLSLPPSLRPELTFHTYALAEPRKPVPRIVFTQFEDDWLFPETNAFGHRLPATELRITKRARDAASELLGLLDTPDRLALAHETYESLSAHVPAERYVLLRGVETILGLARMLAVREHGHAGAGLRVLEQESARIGPTDWLAPEISGFELGRLDALAAYLLDAFPPEALGEAVVDAIQRGGGGPAAPLLLMRRFLDRHAIGTDDAIRFAHAFGRLPRAAWPSESGDDAIALRELIARIAPEPPESDEVADDWESTPVEPGHGDFSFTDTQFAPASHEPATHEFPVGIEPDPGETEPIDVSPETAVLNTLVAGLSSESVLSPFTETVHPAGNPETDEAEKVLVTVPPAAEVVDPVLAAPANPDHARFAPRAAHTPVASASPPPAAVPTPADVSVLEAAPTREGDWREPADVTAARVVGLPDDVVKRRLGGPMRVFAIAASIAGLGVIGLTARALLRDAPGTGIASIAVAGEVGEQARPAPATEPAPDFNERIAQARALAVQRAWAPVLDALSITFDGLTAVESFARDSLVAHASLQLALAGDQALARRRALFANAFEYATRALAAVPPFAPGTDMLRLMQAEACLEGTLQCETAEVVESLVFAVRSPSSAIRGRANELLTRTSPVGQDAALHPGDGGPGRL